MSENIVKLAACSKKEQYESLLQQLEALVAGENDVIANMANVSAAIKEVFGFWWVGFYLVKNGQLVLAPFQGPVACTRIAYGRGVCGTACYCACRSGRVGEREEDQDQPRRCTRL